MNEEREGLRSCVHDTPFVLGEWTVYPSRNQLKRGTETATLQPKVMHLLCTLAGTAEETISRGQLIDIVWDGLHVSDAAIDRAVYSLRRTLGDSATAPRYIETVRKKGLRLIISPAEVPSQPEPVEIPVLPMQLNIAGFQPSSFAEMRGWRQAAAMLAVIVCVLTFWSALNNPMTGSASGSRHPAESSANDTSRTAEEEDCSQEASTKMAKPNDQCTPFSRVLSR